MSQLTTIWCQAATPQSPALTSTRTKAGPECLDQQQPRPSKIAGPAPDDAQAGDRFSVTDIIVGWSLNWGRRSGADYLPKDELPATNAYLDRLLERQNCPFAK